MPSKTEEYLALAQRTANGLTRYWESWTDYLTTASRLYKYPFADQLMIYAQRPDATACASFDIWNNRMNRYVRRGSKGIALLDQSSSVPRLHYVFDVSDTGVLVVENESGLLFTYGHLLGLRAASICVALGSMFADPNANVYGAYADPEHLARRIETATRIAMRAAELLEGSK